MKSIFLGLLLVIVSPQIKAQNNISVPFVDGFIGVRGNNTQSADNIQNFSTLGIERVYFSQNSSGNIFEVQGNDIVGTITLVSSVTGQTLDVPGAIVWRITSGSTLEILGFIPAVGNPVANLSSIGLTSYQLDSDSNYGLKLVSSSFLLVDGTNISGNAASTGLLTALNNYLIEVQQNAPLGPVTVDDLTTTDSTPTISGTVNLASGEIFSVVVNGQTYDSANGVSIDGTNWMLTLPQTNLGTYSISAFITNTASFTLSAIGSLTIQDCQTVNDVPAPPISGGDITSCETLSAQNLVATASVNTGESITWYDAATGGNLVADPSLSTPGTVTYFAEATNDTSGCVGQARTAVTLTIEAAPDAPISGGDISECETIAAQSLVATALAEAGESITWYDAATGGNLVADPSLSTPGTVTYFAEATNDSSGCSSLSRTAVTLTITSVAAPTGEAVQSFCDNVTVSDLSANGTSLQWYDAPTAGNLLNSSYALSDGEMVYVSQTDNGCESVSRLEISVEIDVIPDPILLTTEIEFCIEAEVLLSDIEIDTQGFNLVWYDSYASGTVLPSDTLLEDQVSYFAALVDPSSSCESLNRLEYVPSIIPCEVFVYNALSLNDNGLNDHMVIEGSEYFPENTLQIFNRDGHLVYEKDQYGTGDNLFRGIANVNGIYRSGSKMPTGSYLYVFRYFNPYQQKEFIKKGFLMINSN